jgi:spore coat protein U-like protein
MTKMTPGMIRSGMTVGFAMLALLASAAAQAGTATANLSVSANITANCTISTTDVAFGAYDPISANASTPLTATGAVNTTCTNGASVVVTLDQGANAGSGSTSAVPVRRMANGSSFMNYGLYSDNGDTDTFDGVTGVTVAGTGAQVGTPVYGSIPAGQNLPTGSYTDTVVATVTF